MTNMDKFLSQYDRPRKHVRNDHIKGMTRWNKVRKRLIRAFQRRNNGIHPIASIPKNTFYCESCPHWYEIDITGHEEEHIGCVAMGQHHIGGCKFLNMTDDDMGSWGLLWDQCKECGISTNPTRAERDSWRENSEES